MKRLYILLHIVGILSIIGVIAIVFIWIGIFIERHNTAIILKDTSLTAQKQNISGMTTMNIKGR